MVGDSHFVDLYVIFAAQGQTDRPGQITVAVTALGKIPFDIVHAGLGSIGDTIRYSNFE